jgi:hypothetical protein
MILDGVALYKVVKHGGLFQFSYNPESVCRSYMAATSMSFLQGVKRPCSPIRLCYIGQLVHSVTSVFTRMEKAKLLKLGGARPQPTPQLQILGVARVQLALVRPIFMNNMAFGSWIPRNSC